MTFDEIKEAYVHGASLDETLERLAANGWTVYITQGLDLADWDVGIHRRGRGEGVREAMMAAFDAE